MSEGSELSRLSEKKRIFYWGGELPKGVIIIICAFWFYARENVVSRRFEQWNLVCRWIDRWDGGWDGAHTLGMYAS
jgi:hypothetical protein